MKNSPRHILLFLAFISITFSAFSQTVLHIKGKVTDANKMPIVGASVYIADKSISMTIDSSHLANYHIGTITNTEGLFSFTATENLLGKKIVVSALGYLPTVLTIHQQTFYDITLQQSQDESLKEIVVNTGYQIISTKKLTGAVSAVKMNAIQQTGQQGLDQILAGQLGGVTVLPLSGAPGEAAKIRIRGVASINGSQDPLWVIDGLPIDGTDLPKTQELGNLFTSSIAGFNTNDIESIVVLKDAAATAIYGARAANGVIVVTTKKGRKNEKLQINYNSNYSFTQKPNIERLGLLNSQQKVDLELDIFKENYGFASNRGAVSQILAKYNITANDLKDKNLADVNQDAYNEIEALKQINTNWNDVLFRSSLTQVQNISIAGGGDKARYYFGGGFYDEKGATMGTGLRKYNITLKTDFDLSKKLKLQVNLFANQRAQSSYLTSTMGAPDVISYSRKANPYTPVYHADNTYFYDRQILLDDNGSTIPFNMVEELNNTSNNKITQSLLSSFKIDYQVLPFLKFSSQLGIQKESANGQQIALENSYATRKLKFDRIDNTTNKTYLPSGGFIDISHNQINQWTWKNLLEYNTMLGALHQLDIMLGNELRSIDQDGFTNRRYGYDPQTLQTKSVIYPSSTSANDDNKYNTQYLLNNRFASFFGNLAYTFDNKYTLTSSLRFDGSDMFGVDPQYRYKPIWSIGGLWRMKEENFLQDAHAIDFLNLRASYGLQGNIDKSISKYFVGTRNSRYILPGTATPTLEVSSAPNHKLRWETTHNINFQIEAGLWNRVNFTANYYERLGTDLLDIAFLPLETGFASQSINWGSMQNRGVEIELSTENIVTKNFKWITQFNIAYNQNKVLQQKVLDNAYYPSKEGLPVDAIFTLPYGGINPNTGEIMMLQAGETVTIPKYYNLDYLFNEDFGINYAYTQLSGAQLLQQFQYAGTTQPIYAGGLNNLFYYKGFDLNIGLIFNLGHKVMLQPAYSFYDFNRGYNTTRAILDRWTESNPSGSMPRLIGNHVGVTDSLRATAAFITTRPGAYSDLSLWLRNADYVRVRNITLGYTLPKARLQKYGIKQVRLIAEARNPFVLFGDYKGYLDPETMGNPYAQPIPKTFALGININL